MKTTNSFGLMGLMVAGAVFVSGCTAASGDVDEMDVSRDEAASNVVSKAGLPEEPESPDACPANLKGMTEAGQELRCFCSVSRAEGNGPVWGTNNYTDDSDPCRAAAHSGMTKGGWIQPIVRANVHANGSTRNGITSLSRAETAEWGFYFDIYTDRWMGLLADGTKLSDIDIPGTHDSGAWEGDVWQKTQAMDISAQLNTGVRFLDMGLRQDHNKLYVLPMVGTPSLTLDKVLEACTAFLEAHPSETILMMVRDEFEATGNTQSFSQNVQAYMAASGSAHWYTGRAVPAISEVRGKIVLIRDYEGPSDEGIDASGGVDNSPDTLAGDVYIQDRYMSDVGQKWVDIQSFFAKTDAAADARLYINFANGIKTGSSGSSPLNPKAFSDYINPLLEKHFYNAPAQERHGVVVMDFPSEELLHRIVGANVL